MIAAYRALEVSARVAYKIEPDTRSTVRFGDPVGGIGNSEHIVVSCGN
jgi:hypothetical protein